jgi:ACR3 family arsenite efflux pump ArsB
MADVGRLMTRLGTWGWRFARRQIVINCLTLGLFFGPWIYLLLYLTEGSPHPAQFIFVVLAYGLAPLIAAQSLRGLLPRLCGARGMRRFRRMLEFGNRAAILGIAFILGALMISPVLDSIRLALALTVIIVGVNVAAAFCAYGLARLWHAEPRGAYAASLFAASTFTEWAGVLALALFGPVSGAMFVVLVSAGLEDAGIRVVSLLMGPRSGDADPQRAKIS